MKIRQGFVSNSSSSSFIAFGRPFHELKAKYPEAETVEPVHPWEIRDKLTDKEFCELEERWEKEVWNGNKFHSFEGADFELSDSLFVGHYESIDDYETSRYSLQDYKEKLVEALKTVHEIGFKDATVDDLVMYFGSESC